MELSSDVSNLAGIIQWAALSILNLEFEMATSSNWSQLTRTILWAGSSVHTPWGLLATRASWLAPFNEQCQACTDLGADMAINYKEQDFQAEVCVDCCPSVRSLSLIWCWTAESRTIKRRCVSFYISLFHNAVQLWLAHRQGTKFVRFVPVLSAPRHFCIALTLVSIWHQAEFLVAVWYTAVFHSIDMCIVTRQGCIFTQKYVSFCTLHLLRTVQLWLVHRHKTGMHIHAEVCVVLKFCDSQCCTAVTGV